MLLNFLIIVVMYKINPALKIKEPKLAKVEKKPGFDGVVNSKYE